MAIHGSQADAARKRLGLVVLAEKGQDWQVGAGNGRGLRQPKLSLLETNTPFWQNGGLGYDIWEMSVKMTASRAG